MYARHSTIWTWHKTSPHLLFLPRYLLLPLRIPKQALRWIIYGIEGEPSFGLFTLILILAGGALIFRVPTIFPWPLNPDSSVLFGCIFLGDAFYFFYGLLVPRWSNACGQLLSFLA